MERGEVLRTLVIESEEHYFLANASIELLAPLGPVSVVLSRGLLRGNRAPKPWEPAFPRRGEAAEIVLARQRWIFLTTLSRALRSDLVLVQTGPEHGSLLKVLTFLLFCRLLGGRTVVPVHILSTYLPATGVRGRLRRRALRAVRGVVFETRHMRDTYLARSGWSASRRPALTIAPLRFAPEVPSAQPPLDPDGRVRIGLLGGVTHKRRDFPALERALDLLAPEVRARIRLVTVGNCTKARCHEITGRLGERVAVDVVEGHLSEDELAERGRSCHLLLAVMASGLAYGSDRASGSLCDAVMFGRRFIVDRGLDAGGDYAGVVVPFEGVEELAERLRGAVADPSGVDPAVLARFTATSVRERFVADLGLGGLVGTP